MKFAMRKRHLVDAIDRMYEVATKGVKADFDLAHRITIEPDDKKVIFLATNGHLDARWEVIADKDNQLDSEKSSTVTVDATVIKAIVSSITPDNDLISFELDDKDVLHIRVMGLAKKQKRYAKMQTLSKFHDFEIPKPRKGFSYQTKVQDFRQAIQIGRYASRLGYKIRYQMICLHFLEEETRYVCGDGMRFAVWQHFEEKKNPQVENEDGVKYLLPADQAAIIACVAEGAESMDLVFKDYNHLYISPHNAATLMLNGIPSEKYIAYDKHAFRHKDAKAIVDVLRTSLEDSFIGALRDRAMEVEGHFLACQFESDSDGVFSLTVDQGKYQGQYSCEADFYDLANIGSFKSAYANMYLDDVAKSDPDKKYIRFYCIDTTKTIIARPVDLEDADSGPSSIKGTAPLTFFFAAVIED